jgi:hypothetical protein
MIRRPDFPKVFVVISAILLAPLAFSATAAGPSTPEDWQRLYAACLEGAQTVATQRGLGPSFPATFCRCIRDDLKGVPEADRDAQSPAIRDRCLQRATLAQGYPEAGIANLRATCMQQQDIPAQAITTACACYIDLVQKNVPWRDILFLESAIATKGLDSLDAEEIAILGKTLQAMSYCSQKATR